MVSNLSILLLALQFLPFVLLGRENLEQKGDLKISVFNVQEKIF
jgi:hypothetical protein